MCREGNPAGGIETEGEVAEQCSPPSFDSLKSLRIVSINLTDWGQAV